MLRVGGWLLFGLGCVLWLWKIPFIQNEKRISIFFNRCFLCKGSKNGWDLWRKPVKFVPEAGESPPLNTNSTPSTFKPYVRSLVGYLIRFST
jgi:hypothetical protein